MKFSKQMLDKIADKIAEKAAQDYGVPVTVGSWEISVTIWCVSPRHLEQSHPA